MFKLFSALAIFVQLSSCAQSESKRPSSVIDFFPVSKSSIVDNGFKPDRSSERLFTKYLGDTIVQIFYFNSETFTKLIAFDLNKIDSTTLFNFLDKLDSDSEKDHIVSVIDNNGTKRDYEITRVKNFINLTYKTENYKHQFSGHDDVAPPNAKFNDNK